MITNLHVFTEEPSAKKVFDIILPKILPENVYFTVHPHQGKQDLERALKTTIPSISKMPGAKILITRDQDSGDCLLIKGEIETIVNAHCKCDYYIRIVCRELEAWFLGDLNAIELAYPRFKASHYSAKASFRNVDKLTGPNKHLLRMLPEYSDRTNLPKLEVSENISPFMNLESNSSDSFNHTITAIKKLVGI